MTGADHRASPAAVPGSGVPGPRSLAGRVLAVLARDTGRTDTDLAATLGITQAELSPVIGRLYRRGLADRCGPYIVAPAPPSRRSGTSGTSGTNAGQPAQAGFRWPGEVPEPPEPSPSAPVRPLPCARPLPDPQEDAMPSPSPAADLPRRLRDSALACAARGWPVFPIRPRAKKPPAFPDHDAAHCTGTDPRCRGGHIGWESRATTDPARIRRAWERAPYNIGIATGPAGLVVVDLDKPKPGEKPPREWAAPGITDGADVLAELCLRHGQPWPGETFTARTGRGGLHLYYSAPPGTRLGNTSGDSARGLGWLIDTRAHGGYVVGPGSVVHLPDGTGRYEVVYDHPPAPLPGWLAALLTAPVPDPRLECRPSAAGKVRDLGSYAASALKRECERVRAAAEGGRNHALNKAAFHLGQLVPAGILPEDLASAELYDAASVHFGIGSPAFTPADARATIRAGIAAGKRKPRPLATLGAAA